MVFQRQQIVGGQHGTRRFHMGRGHAGRKLHPYIHQGQGRGLEKVVNSGQTADIGNLVRVADRSGDAARGDATVKLERGDKAAFDVQMGVDETRHQDLTGHVNLAPCLIIAEDADDGIAADSDIRLHQVTGDQVKHPSAPQQQIGGNLAPRLGYPVGQFGFGHGYNSLLCPKRPQAARKVQCGSALHRSAKNGPQRLPR